jgi:hypothetical protein
MKLTGWYRIGIVLSVLWCFFIIGITIYQYNNPNENGYFVILKLGSPESIPPPPHGSIPVNPYVKLDDVVFDEPCINYRNIFSSMIVPVVVGWVLILTIIWTTKWIIRGFKSHSSK